MGIPYDFNPLGIGNVIITVYNFEYLTKDNINTSAEYPISLTDFTNFVPLTAGNELKAIYNFNTSNGINFTKTCYQCTNLSSVSKLNLNKGTIFTSMFEDCSNLKFIDDMSFNLNNQNINADSFSRMFYNCNSLTGIPSTAFNAISSKFTEKLSNTNNFFIKDKCDALITYSRIQYNWLSSHNWIYIPAPHYSYYCVYNNTNRKAYDIGTSKDPGYASLAGIFKNDQTITIFNKVDEDHNIGTIKVTNISNLFSNCKNLITVEELGYFDNFSSDNAKSAFLFCTNLISIPDNISTYIKNNFPESLNICNHCFTGCNTIRENNPEFWQWILEHKWGENPLSALYIDINNIDQYKEYCSDDTDFSDFFKNNSDIKTLKSIDLASAVTTISMFSNCYNLENILCELKIENVNNVESMFNECTVLKYINDIKVPASLTDSTKYNKMFYNCTSLTAVPLSLMDHISSNIGKISKNNNCFVNCEALVNDTSYKQYNWLGENNWLTPYYPVSTAEYTLYNGTHKTKIYSSNKTDFSDFFTSDEKKYLTSVDVLQLSSGTDLHNMFYGCSKLTNFTCITNFNIDKADTTESMFDGCISLPYLSEKFFNGSSNSKRMFYNCKNLTTDNDFNRISLASADYMFYNCKNLLFYDNNILPFWLTVNNYANASLNNTFAYCDGLTSIYIDNYNAHGYNYNYNCGEAFAYCKNLKKVQLCKNDGYTYDGSIFDTINTSYMFTGCSSLTTINQDNGFEKPCYLVFNPDDTGNANYSYMFHDCINLTSYMNIFFDRHNKKCNCAGLFYNCSSLTSANILAPAYTPATPIHDRIFDSIINSDYMFYNCINLSAIPMSKNLPYSMSFPNTKSCKYMFANCKNLLFEHISALNTSSCIDFTGMFENADFTHSDDIEKLKFYFTSTYFNLSAGSTFSYMFRNTKYSNMGIQDIKHIKLDLSHGMNFDYMFADHETTYFGNEFTLNTTNSTANGQSFIGMFQNCLSLQTIYKIDFSGITRSIGTELARQPELIASAFYNCSNLETIPQSVIDFISGTYNNFTLNEPNNMFYGCTKLLQNYPKFKIWLINHNWQSK